MRKQNFGFPKSYSVSESADGLDNFTVNKHVSHSMTDSSESQIAYQSVSK